MPSRRAMACAVVRLSPVSMTTRTPSARRASRAAGVDALIGIGDGDDARRLAVDARRRWTVAPSARSFSASPASAATSTPCARPGRRRYRARRACLRRRRWRPCRSVSRSSDCRASAILRCFGSGDDGGRERMLARPLDAGRQPQQGRLVERRRPQRRQRPWACLRSGCPSCRRRACRPSPCVPALRRS